MINEGRWYHQRTGWSFPFYSPDQSRCSQLHVLCPVKKVSKWIVLRTSPFTLFKADSSMATRGMMRKLHTMTFEPNLLRLCQTVTESALQGALTSAYHTPNWQLVGTHLNTEIWHLKDSSDYHKFRRVGHISASPSLILDYLLNPANAKRWNETLSESRLLRSIGQYQIIYQRTELPWPIKPRDYVVLATGREVTGGKAYVLSSVDIPEAPPRAEAIRAHIAYSVVIAKEDQKGGSDVTYVSSVKLNGDLPHRVVYHLIKTRNTAIERIRDAFDQW